MKQQLVGCGALMSDGVENEPNFLVTRVILKDLANKNSYSQCGIGGNFSIALGGTRWVKNTTNVHNMLIINFTCFLSTSRLLLPLLLLLCLLFFSFFFFLSFFLFFFFLFFSSFFFFFFSFARRVFWGLWPPICILFLRFLSLPFTHLQTAHMCACTGDFFLNEIYIIFVFTIKFKALWSKAL